MDIKYNKNGQPRKPQVFTEKNANGNNNTKPIKWTKSVVIDILTQLKAESIEKKEEVYIKSLFIEKPYSYDMLALKISDYKMDKNIARLWKDIKEIFENRVIKGAIRGNLNAPFVQFLLKNKYNWKDKQENKLNVSGNMSLGELFDKVKQKK